jgi:nucleotide-binding universal stress UspA family protein
MRPAQVIVGVDTSPESRLALRWAAAEAERRGRTLRVIHGVRSRWPDSVLNPPQARLVAQDRAPQVLAAARADVREWAPDIELEASAELGGGAAVLIAAARAGDLVVVGSRGHSGFAALLAGSTCQQVATHAPTSVVVVRGRTGRLIGGVVVGFDGSPMTEDLLATAFDMADAGGCGLTVLRAYRPSMPPWPSDTPPDLLNATTAKVALQVDIAETLLPLADKYPAVPVHVEVAGGNPAEVLVEASREAQVVIVGSRGHGGFAGLLLGSVGLHLIHHADCPVLLVRTHAILDGTTSV